MQPQPRAGVISVLVISPTRELATQISKEASAVLTHHPYKAQVVYGALLPLRPRFPTSVGPHARRRGNSPAPSSFPHPPLPGGTNMNSEKGRLERDRCDVLIATPGRLTDHIQNTGGFRDRLSGLRVLILDEADQLLDMGFRRDIERILAALPRERQTLLFSATMPPEVRTVAGLALRRDHAFVDTVGEEASHTHEHVRQRAMVAPLEAQQSALLDLLRSLQRADPEHKVIVFFVTARATQFHAELFALLGVPALEIHSRKSQAQRDRASAQFRAARSGFLFTSDVSARGVDYPDVTAVVQVGAPADRSQYIHRLGRTARAGKVGEGFLLLCPFEQFVLRELRDLPVEMVDPPAPDRRALDEVQAALRRVDSKTAEQCYQAWLGYYNGSLRKLGWSKEQLVQQANFFSAVIGLPQPPALLKKTVGMMGLKGVPGLRIA